MYKIYVIYKCFPGKRDIFLNKIKEAELDKAIRAEDGCLQYEYFLPDANDNEILLLETWETKDHQKVHYTQPHMKDLGELKAEYVETVTLGEYELKG